MERKSSAYLNSDDMFSTYSQKTYMENIPCELALMELHILISSVMKLDKMTLAKVLSVRITGAKFDCLRLLKDVFAHTMPKANIKQTMVLCLECVPFWHCFLSDILKSKRISVRSLIFFWITCTISSFEN